MFVAFRSTGPLVGSVGDATDGSQIGMDGFARVEVGIKLVDVNAGLLQAATDLCVRTWADIVGEQTIRVLVLAIEGDPCQ
jgi:hypothetical protein